jgi:hypothetical protein
MNYLKIYNQLVEGARNRVLDGYCEKHHVVPKCMGGDNKKSNIVLFTAKEHFIAHKLLVRIYPNVKGLWYALIAMGRISEFKARVFASERAKAAEMRRGVKYSAESRAKMSAAKKGKKSPSPATTFKKGQLSWNAGKCGTSNHMYGTKRTEEQRKRMSEAQRLCGNIPPSRKGIKMTEEQKEKARVVRAFNKQLKQVGGFR